MTVPPSLSPAWLQNVGKKRPKAGGQQAQVTGLCGTAVTQNHISMTTVMILTVTGGQSPTCKQNMKHRLRCDPFNLLSYIHTDILHRLQILRASIQTKSWLSSSKKKKQKPHVSLEGCIFCAGFFVRILLLFKGFKILVIYTQR